MLHDLDVFCVGFMTENYFWFQCHIVRFGTHIGCDSKVARTCSKEIVVQALKKKWSYYSFCDKLRGNLTVLDVGMNGEVTVVEPVT